MPILERQSTLTQGLEQLDVKERSVTEHRARPFMRIRDKRNAIVLEHCLIAELRMWILSELASWNYSATEKIVALASRENLAHRTRITRVDATQNPVATDKRFACGVEP